MIRSSILSIAALAAMATPSLAAECGVDQIGARYNATVEISVDGVPWTAFSEVRAVRIWSGGVSIFTDGGGDPVVITSSQCSNLEEVYDGVREAMLNRNQCVGIMRAGTFSGQDRVLLCEAAAD